MMKKNKKKFVSEPSNSGLYTVIKFIDENDDGDVSFDCTPDIWFTDEHRESCLWPPPKGKSVAIRALKQEVPDESWKEYKCEVVKGGFATYSCGRAFVREKCAQKYNTSSADEHIAAAKFRSTRSRSRYSRENSVSSGPTNSSDRLQKEKYDRSYTRTTKRTSLSLGTSRQTARNHSSNDRRNSSRCRSRSINSRCPSISNGANHSSFRLQDKNYENNSDRASGKASLPLESSSRKAATDRQLPLAPCSLSCQMSHDLLKNVMEEVRVLTKTVVKNHHQNDRRLARMEVSVNKALVRIGDITRSTAAHLSNDSPSTSTQRSSGETSYREEMRGSSGQVSRYENHRISCGQDSRRQHEYVREINQDASRSMLRERQSLDVPITILSELVDLNLRLKDKIFFAFLVDREIEFCMPDKNSSNTVIISTYLKRFISLRVRSLLTLKESKKETLGLTLYADFYNVYDFLTTVMYEAYKSDNKTIKMKEVHEALRIVWGRSKQLLDNEVKRLR